MDSERFVPFILYTERIAKNIKRLADAKMEPYGLRSAHVMCILQLAKSEKGLSSAELSVACGVDKAFVSRVTTELTEKGYIIRSGAAGKYKTKFVLTDEGLKIYDLLQDLLCKFIGKINKNTPIRKLEIFYEVLGSIDDGLAQIIDKEI
jgi:MarR family transcriptional regulator for hemolysin